MSRHDLQRLEDVRAACAAIAEHLTQGDLAQGLVFDAVRVRLIEIGEAVKTVDTDLLSTEAEIPWRQISRMRDQLAHRYFDTSHAIVAGSWPLCVPRPATAEQPGSASTSDRTPAARAQRQ